MRWERVLVGTLAFAMLTIGLSPTAAAVGDTLVVDDDGLQCPQAGFSSIQAAVDAAQAGDKVAVCGGVYDETVDVDTPSVTVCGAVPGGVSCGLACVDPGNCPAPGVQATIDGTDRSADFVLSIDAGDVAVRGLEIVAGVAQSGVDVNDGSATLEGNTIVSTATDDDGGVRTIGADVVAGQATITDNRFVGWIANAVGIWRGDATVTDNTFVDNRVGVHLADAADNVLVAGNTFTGHLWPVRIAGGTTSLEVSDNDLGPSNAFSMRVEPDAAADLEPFAPNNWWGALTCQAIQERIDDPGDVADVIVTPYRGPTGAVVGPNGVADVSEQDPSC